MSTVFFGQTQKTSCCNSGLSASSTTTKSESRCCSLSSSKEEAIREKAYLLWEQAGRPEGDGVDFWVEAEKQLFS